MRVAERQFSERRGFVLAEALVGLGVIALALSVGMAAWSQASLAGRLQEKRTAAREAINLGLERLRAMDARWFPLPGAKKDVELPPTLAKRLSGGACKVWTEAINDDSNRKRTIQLIRVHMEVSWSGTAEQGGRGAEQGEIVLQFPTLTNPEARQ